MNASFSFDALWAKSKVFIDRGLVARDDGNDGDFHLWAAISLELLAKARLAKIHPALVADPNDQKSLLYACGAGSPVQIRSISAKTVYERLSAIDPKFDKQTKDFCMTMANRRNAELHSGESPTIGLNPKAWIPAFWKAVDVILKAQGKALADWVTESEATGIQKILTDTAQLLEQAVIARIRRRKDEFADRFAAADDDAKRRTVFQSASRSPLPQWVARADALERCGCPACGSSGWLLGYETDTDIVDEVAEVDDRFGEFPLVIVDVTYTVDAFRCIECGLELNGIEEVAIADLPSQFHQETEMEPDYEPDYGND